MLYAADIGNSSVSVGVVEAGTVLHFFRFPTTKGMSESELNEIVSRTLGERGVSAGEVGSAVVCSVVPELDPLFYSVLKRAFSVDALFVDCRMDLGIKASLARPDETGIDRLVNATAAHSVCDSDVIVIDFGTAITFDHVTSAGEFTGGVIAPGAGISLNALIGHASRIGGIEMLPPEQVIGTDTASAVRSGIFHGFTGLVENIVAKMKEEISCEAKVIATGGAFTPFKDALDIIDSYDEHLTIKGLMKIFALNRQ